MDVISAFLRNHYVEVYSAIVDLRYAVYLLYWYKSTNTDAAHCRFPSAPRSHRFSGYLLYWYKSANTDAAHAQHGSVGCRSLKLP